MANNVCGVSRTGNAGRTEHRIADSFHSVKIALFLITSMANNICGLNFRSHNWWLIIIMCVKLSVLDQLNTAEKNSLRLFPTIQYSKYVVCLFILD